MHGAPLGLTDGGDSSGLRKGGTTECRRGRDARVGANDAAMEGAEVGKMTAEPSVRHVLPSRAGLYFCSLFIRRIMHVKP